MKKMKKIAAAALSMLMIAAAFTACSDETDDDTDEAGFADSVDKSNKNKDDQNNSDENNVTVEAPDLSELGEPAAPTGKMLNYTAPEIGENIIVMTIKDRGDVKIKLFPEQAPKGVANFEALASKGYYDGLIFHRIIKNFMIQGGDPMGTGMGGVSAWGDKFDGGVSEDLNHVAGAVAYANSGSTATNGSQFYIVTGDKYSENDIMSLELNGYSWEDEVKKAYEEQGGAPWLDGGYTVFGQVFDGLDIVFDIQNVVTDASDRPSEDVIIEKITVQKYNGEDVKFYMSDYK